MQLNGKKVSQDFQKTTNIALYKTKSQKKIFTFFEREQLNEECLHLKEQINELKECVIVLRNQKQFLANELQKKDKQIESFNQGIFF